LATHGTPLHAKHGDPDTLVWAIAALAEGLGSRAVARGFEVDPNTVRGWRGEAAPHLEAFSRYFWHDVAVAQVQRDELFALLRAVQDGEGTEAEALTRLARSPQWVWVARDPVGQLILAVDVGERTLARAQRLGQQVTKGLVLHGVPRFLTDGLRDHLTALGTHDGQWVQSARHPDKGPPPTPRWIPLPGWLYAPGGQSSRRLVGGTHRVVFGPAAPIKSLLPRGGGRSPPRVPSACIWIFVSVWRPSGGGATRWAHTKRDGVSS
jgi:hypothetical protein